MDNVRGKLEEALRIDSIPGHAWVNLHVGDEILAVCAFDTEVEAQSQRELLIDSLARLFQH